MSKSRFLTKKRKVAIAISAGTVVGASGISVGIIANNNHKVDVPAPVVANQLSLNFSTENGKVHLHKLVSEPVGYANGDLQLEVHDANGNLVNDAIFTNSGLPEGIHISETGVLNGVAQHDGIFFADIKVNSASLNASASLDLEVDVPKPIEVKAQDVNFIDIVGYRGGQFSIAEADENDKYEIISGVLPAGIIFNNDSGVFSGTPQESGLFSLTVRVTNDNYEYSYSDIHVNLNVETVAEALTIGVENLAQDLGNNVNQYNALVDSLTNTLNVGKDIYSKNVEVVDDINSIIANTKNTYSEIVNLFEKGSAVFTTDWWKNAGNAALSKAELTIEQYSDEYFLPIASVVDGAVDTIDSLKNSLGSILSLVGVSLPEIKETYQSLINMGARILTGDKVYLSEFTVLLDLLESQLAQTRDAFEAISAYVPSDEQTQAWQKEIDELKIQRDQYPAFVDSEGTIPNGSKTEGSIIKTTAEWRDVTYKIEDDQVVITGGEARHSLMTLNQWISLTGSDYVKTSCDTNGHIEIKLFDFVTIVSFDAPASPERFAIQQQIDEIQAKIDAAALTSGLLDNETKQQIASIGEIINTVIGVVTQAKEILPTALEYIAQIGIDGLQLPWAILENKNASELVSLTDIANALHEDYLFNVNRWDTFANEVTGLYNDGQKAVNDVQQIVTDLQNLVAKIQNIVIDAQADLTNAINDNIDQFNKFVDSINTTIETINILVDVISNVA
ncbi:MAG: Ig domain-containing protein [Mycoplasmataceae bacterium]|nr:Ig domain-containing protein [Mycoplasmataceae bacterium]